MGKNIFTLEHMLKDVGIEDSALILFSQSAAQESFRGGVLIGVAHIDELLLRLLCHFMVQEKSVLSLFQSGGALYDLKAKIEVAFGFGLISKDEHDDLDVLRKIRNTIAHCTSLDEEMDSIRDRSGNICGLSDEEKSGKEPEEVIRLGISAAIIKLCARIRKTQPRCAAEELAAEDFW